MLKKSANTGDERTVNAGFDPLAHVNMRRGTQRTNEFESSYMLTLIQ